MRYTDLNSTISKRQVKANLAEKDKKHKKNGGAIKIALFAIVLLVIIGGALFWGGGVSALFNPISVIGNAATSGLKETDGRTNVLVLGSDQRSKGSIVNSVLTDTILVASIGHVEGNVTLISLPRDLWVKSPQGYHSKINAIYANGGGDELSAVVEEVLGIPIHYYAVVNFDIFKDSIDILGGVDVNVDKAFIDYYYPIEGKENAPEEERYEVVKFDAGHQTMNGETALKYVRSRKGDNDEGTDFARSRRQQKVIMAIKDKVLSIETLIDPIRLKELYDSYSTNVDTNVDFSVLNGFYFLSQKLNFNDIRSIVLDDRSGSDQGGLLYAPEDRSLYQDAYVLIPKAGNFSQLHAYVQRYIFGDL